ncbi:MAG TPA: enoyl-CoA hydratase/isomerase family protein [Pyrinomonadaceae bacterium]|nr:enoyl-CoA hydratase/isomerase family protein [Pyrinomonadaceae bacterium]
MGDDKYQQLIYAKRGNVVEITLNRSDVLNALSVELYTELGDALIAASNDADVQVIVITGAGRAFSTGGDLKQGDNLNRDEPGRFAEASDRMLKQILASAKTIVAKVNGIAQAGGLLIVAACDLAVASERATFRCPEALVGIWEPYSPVLLPPQIGIKRTKYMLLASETIDAAEAERIGLINRAVPHDELDRATEELIEHVLAGGPKTRRMFKQMVNKHFLDFDTRIVIEALSSEEGLEGMAAFAEKRRPKWRE